MACLARGLEDTLGVEGGGTGQGNYMILQKRSCTCFGAPGAAAWPAATQVAAAHLAGRELCRLRVWQAAWAGSALAILEHTQHRGVGRGAGKHALRGAGCTVLGRDTVVAFPISWCRGTAGVPELPRSSPCFTLPEGSCRRTVAQPAP